jgi:hypothetical protein
VASFPYLNLFKSAQSAELFLLFVSSASSVVKSRGYFGEAAETFTRAARTQAGKLCAPQIRGIRVIRGCLLLLLFVPIRVHLLAKNFGVRGSCRKILRNFP